MPSGKFVFVLGVRSNRLSLRPPGFLFRGIPR